jgi:hypothetical protein
MSAIIGKIVEWVSSSRAPIWKGEFTVKGTKEVKLVRDQQGVTHIYGESLLVHILFSDVRTLYLVKDLPMDKTDFFSWKLSEESLVVFVFFLIFRENFGNCWRGGTE